MVQSLPKAKAPSTPTPAQRKGARVVGGARAELQTDLKTRYESGTSIRALAHEVGRSYGFVHKVLVESKAVLRARGGAHPVPPEAKPVAQKKSAPAKKAPAGKK